MSFTIAVAAAWSEKRVFLTYTNINTRSLIFKSIILFFMD